MHSDIKKARITIQDFKLPSKDYHSVTIPRQGLLSRKSIKKSILVFMNTQRKYKRLVYNEDEERLIKHTRPIFQLSNSIKNQLPTTKIVNLPQQTFQEYTQGTEMDDNPQEKIATYASVKINRGLNQKGEKSMSEKNGQKKAEGKQCKMPIISQPLFTISDFSDAFNSIPKHTQTSIQRLRILKKTMMHIPQIDKKKLGQSLQIPQELRTFRVVKKTSQDKFSSTIVKNKFRTLISKQKRPTQKNEGSNYDRYKIQGWEEQRKPLFE